MQATNPSAAGAKCAHANCSCTVPAGQQYCSPMCREAAESARGETQGPKGDCGCGHAACRNG